MEPIIVRGFDVEPPDYPALPAVEGDQDQLGEEDFVRQAGRAPDDREQ